MHKPQFLWGAATSAHQIEGYNEHSDWWEWEKAGHIAGGVKSGPACDHWHRAAEDVRLAASLGLGSYRFSVEWAKVEPNEGEWSAEALAWYVSLLDLCEENNLLPMVTLHHFTLPMWLAQRGGFSCAESPKLFARYAEKIHEAFGGRVSHWCTFNEPSVMLLGAYIGKFMPPAIFAPKLFAAASAHILEAHILTYAILHRPTHRQGPWREERVAVGIAHNMLDFIPDRWWHPMERLLCPLIRRFYNRAWLDALTGKSQHFGLPPLVPSPPQVKAARGQSWLDFVGVNYYTKAYVRWRPRDPSAETLAQLPVGVAFARRREEQSDLGWAHHPKGFERVIEEAAAYGLPLYITENGVADKDDQLRGKYLLSHLRVLADLIRRGLEIKGYYHWSQLDNFEWIKGFGPRFGLVEIDYETFERQPRPSAFLYQDIIEAHQFELPPALEILEAYLPNRIVTNPEP